MFPRSVLWSLAASGTFVFGLAFPRPDTEEDSVAAPPPAQNWPSFRGPGASGIAEGYRTPLSWDLEVGGSVRWITPVPGLAHSSPVIWGNHLFLTTAVSAEEPELVLAHERGADWSVEDEGANSDRLYCFDKRDGSLRWMRVAHEGAPRVKRHRKSSHANSTPTTDGKRVLAFFGSEGLYCFDMQGELLWSRDFGVLDSGYYLATPEERPRSQWGFGSSPVLHDGVAYVQCDTQDGGFLAALDARTGTELWRAERDEIPTWSTPAIDVHPGRSQVVVNGFKHIGGYDLATGAELWRIQGGGDIPVPTPLVTPERIFITSLHGRFSPILAVDPDAVGEMSILPRESHFLHWGYLIGGSYLQTPIVYGDYYYSCFDGILSCFEAATGEKIYKERLGTSGFTSSAVAADGKLYYTSDEGQVHVVRAGPEFDVLGVSDLGETCLATPAISEGVLYFRTRSRVLAIGVRPQEPRVSAAD